MHIPAGVMAEIEKKVSTKLAARLSYEKRTRMPKKQFALPSKKEPGEPGKGAYPIPDLKHARNALARVSQHGSPSERAAVRRKVYAKFPQLKEHHEERTGQNPTAPGVIRKEKLGMLKAAQGTTTVASSPGLGRGTSVGSSSAPALIPPPVRPGRGTSKGVKSRKLAFYLRTKQAQSFWDQVAGMGSNLYGGAPSFQGAPVPVGAGGERTMAGTTRLEQPMEMANWEPGARVAISEPGYEGYPLEPVVLARTGPDYPGGVPGGGETQVADVGPFQFVDQQQMAAAPVKQPMVTGGAKQMPPKVSSDLDTLQYVQELAFQEEKAKYAQDYSEQGALTGPVDRLQEIRNRQIDALPALAGIGAGYTGHRELTKRMVEEAEALTKKMRKARKAGRANVKLPWYMAEHRIVGKGLKRGVTMRPALRWASRLGLPIAGLWAAKGLFGREPKYAEFQKRAQVGDWMGEHPMATAGLGALAGGLAPWAMSGIANRLGYEFDPSAISGVGMAAGGLTGLLAARRAARKRQIREAQLARKQQARQMQRMMLAAQAGAPFGR